MQDVAGQWLAYGRAEAALAARLIAVGLEKPAHAHAKAAKECMRAAAKACECRTDAGAELMAGLEEYRSEAAERTAYSEELLAR